MSDDLDQVRERARQNREAMSDDLRLPGPTSTTAADAVLRPPIAGDRVRDRVTGKEGVVLPLPATRTAAGALLSVRTADGRIVVRLPESLELLPAPPAA